MSRGKVKDVFIINMAESIVQKQFLLFDTNSRVYCLMFYFMGQEIKAKLKLDSDNTIVLK